MAELAQIFTTICLPVLAAMGLGWLLDRKFGLDLNTLVKINIYLLVPCFIFTRVASSQLGSAEAGKIILFTAAVIAFLQSFENYNTTIFSIGGRHTLVTEIGARMRFGMSPMINAIGILFIILTVIFAIGWAVLRQRERRAEAAR